MLTQIVTNTWLILLWFVQLFLILVMLIAIKTGILLLLAKVNNEGEDENDR